MIEYRYSTEKILPYGNVFNSMITEVQQFFSFISNKWWKKNLPNQYTTQLVLSIHQLLRNGKKRRLSKLVSRRGRRPCLVLDLVKVEPRTRSTSISPVFRRAFFVICRFSSTLII